MVTVIKKKTRSVDVFLSHKNVDKDAGLKLQKLLMENFKVSVFLSSDTHSIQCASDWQDVIEKRLRQADVLVLLFSSSGDNWDWCMYEVGYFLGSQVEGMAKRLVVLHPQGVEPPSPLKKIQTVYSLPEKVEAWLTDMLVPKKGRDCSVVANDVAKLVQALALKCFTSRNILQIDVPLDSFDDEKNYGLSKAVVSFSNGAGGLFECADCKYPWRELERRFTNCRFDIEGLRLLLDSVRCHRHLSSTALQLFVAPGDSKGYRPAVVSGHLGSESVRVTLNLFNIPGTFETENANAFDTAYQLVLLACRFRRDVVETHCNELETARNGKSDTDLLIRNLQRRIESHRTEAINRRITIQRLMETFDDDDQQVVGAILSKWRAAYERLESCKREVQEVRKIITVMRHLNYQFLLISLRRLSHLTQKVRLPSTDILAEDPELLNLLP